MYPQRKMTFKLKRGLHLCHTFIFDTTSFYSD